MLFLGQTLTTQLNLYSEQGYFNLSTQLHSEEELLKKYNLDNLWH